MWMRVCNIVLGVWLFISAFAWPHSQPELTNTWICGVLAVVFALIALNASQARYLNTALAIWLFFGSLGLPHLTVGTPWNNCLVALAIFFLSLEPGQLPMAKGPHRMAET